MVTQKCTRGYLICLRQIFRSREVANRKFIFVLFAFTVPQNVTNLYKYHGRVRSKYSSYCIVPSKLLVFFNPAKWKNISLQPCFSLCRAQRTSQYMPWYLYYMVTQNMLRTFEGKLVFSEKKIRFLTPLDLTDQMTEISLHTCLPIFKLSSIINTMICTGNVP